MNEMNANRVFSNFIWRFLERCGAQGVSLVVSIILARLLAPEAYGTVALVTVFTTILNVFISSGLGTALIQKKDPDDLDFSTVFWANLGLCLTLYGLLFLAAPLIAAFYEKPELTTVVRVLGLTLVISGVKGIQHSYVSKHMLFKRFFFSTLGGMIGGAVVGIYMAYRGYGVWALVAQSLFNNLVDTGILWITVKWRPKWMFSWQRLKGLYSYGWKLLVASLIDNVYIELRQLLVGKIYTTSDLAFYNKGQQFPHFALTSVNSSINSVLLPAMAAEQDSKERVKAMTRRALKTSTYIMMPMMVGMAACAEPLIRFLMTDTWLPCVPYLRIYCIINAFYPINTANRNAIKAIGRSDLFLGLEIINKVVGLALLFATIFISVEAMAYSLLVSTLLCQIVNSWPNRKLLGYTYLEQIKDILPQITLSGTMGVAVYCVSLLGLSDIVTLLIQIPFGVAIYVLGSKLFKLDSFAYLLGVLKRLLTRRKK